eukprot:9470424-Pyramimonas_sp.AAC.1
MGVRVEVAIELQQRLAQAGSVQLCVPSVDPLRITSRGHPERLGLGHSQSTQDDDKKHQVPGYLTSFCKKLLPASEFLHFLSLP